jgi:hypothetical protein
LNHWDIYSDESDDTILILKNIKQLRLEEFFLRSYRGDLNVLWEFLRQNESTLKSLLLGHCDLTVEMLEVVCDLLPNLEELRLEDYNDSVLAVQKLKKLKKFSAFISTENNVLEVLTLAITRTCWRSKSSS